MPEDQLSIAIGKGGQNVRLASKLTGYEIDIAAEKEAEPEPVAHEVVAEPAKKPKLKKKEQLESSLLEAIEKQAENKTKSYLALLTHEC